MTRLELTIEGMRDDECISVVLGALEDLAGVEVDHVELGAASLRYDSAWISEAAIIEVLGDEGYSADRD